MSRGGSASESGSGSEADHLSGSEYGPLKSDDEGRLSATGLVCTKNQAGESAEAKIRERLLATLSRRATTGKRYRLALRTGVEAPAGVAGAREQQREQERERESKNGSGSNSGGDSGSGSRSISRSSSVTSSGSNSRNSSGNSSGSTVAHEGDSMQHARSSRPGSSVRAVAV